MTTGYKGFSVIAKDEFLESNLLWGLRSIGIHWYLWTVQPVQQQELGFHAVSEDKRRGGYANLLQMQYDFA